MRRFCEIGNTIFLKISGKDSGTFLHNICTNDIMKMKVGNGLLAGFCNRAGKPQLLADIKKLAESEYLLRFQNTEPATAINFLKHYIIMEKVDVENISNNYRFYICVTNREESHWKLPNEPFSFSVWEDCFIFNNPCTSKNDIGIISPKDISSRLQAMSYDTLPNEELESLRIDYGYPVWGKEITPDYLLQEANLGSLAVSYTKGCYTGQEVIMRMKTYGELSKKLMLITQLSGNSTNLLSNNMNSITKDGQTIGQIVSFSKDLGLCYIVKPHHQQQEFTATCGSSKVVIRTTGFDLDYNRYI
ncbi:MAG: hypothetical protein HY606_15290 [Planctomycetes bacterium]|nr:hypothetical protein [Planctomycetota bacterium]